ncbi:DUF1801 domain-containing protein [Portibacter lacus]|uniref:YdhG-like domain-containing protein n=1 Tax=Portibacter lacus TaxID=1099794 RepID=A0AA37SRG3_9BACT|nr:DUF1801 domain-containing protein [Portibacter lacus]GLR19516.1 hypothetical protein GCM10007940_41320 [Portibacter lacus]
MSEINVKSDPSVKEKFENYPEHIRPKMENLRRIVLETAQEIETIKDVEETLKWGEPSYLVKKGSTVRMDYKEKKPDQYAVYFKCTSLIVPTIKEIYGDLFNYETTRAIVFGLDEEVPEEALKTCIGFALKYHTIKHLPLLGEI